MITEELIIDGTAVDMDESAAVALNFISNLLGDIDAIETSRSQTISLPKTAHNRAVLDDPAGQSRDSSARYVRHSAKYRRNGVEVIPDGYAILLRCADTYEVALYWGLLSQLQSWLDEEGDIGDLGWEPAAGLRTWEKGNSTPYSNIALSALGMYVWADYDCGVGDRADTEASSEDVALHPFVSVWTLLYHISQRAGFDIEGFISDGLIQQMMYEGVFVESANLEDTHDPVSATNIYIDDYGIGFYALRFTFPSNDYFYVTTKGSPSYCYVVTNYEGRCVIDIDLTIDTRDFTYDEAYLQLYFSGRWYRGEEVSGQPTYTRIRRTFYLDAQEGSSYHFEIWSGIDSKYNSYSITLVSGTLGVGAPSGDDKIVLGDTYPASANLPDISQVDFLKAVCAMHGMFVMADADGLLHLRTLSDITSNRANAVDWSDRLVASDTPCEPGETALSWGDYAKHNWFKYKEDDTVSTDGDGDLRVYNEALDEEKDIVTLPFAATDETTRHGETKAYIPHYSTEDDGDIKTESVKARIVQFTEGADGNTVARFSGLRFSRLLSNWSELSALLNSCVAITEYFRLTEYDLLNLDYLKPVYLRQYGRYYGIVSVQTQDDGTCKAELLRLPLEDTTEETE